MMTCCTPAACTQLISCTRTKLRAEYYTYLKNIQDVIWV